MQYTKFLRWGVLGGLVLTLFVPFIVATGQYAPSLFFPYISGKNFAFRIIVEIIFGLYILLALRDPKYRPKASWLLWASAAFVAWMGLATLFSVDPVKSFWSNFERMDGYINVIHIFLYFVVAASVLTVDRWWSKFLQISVAASVLQALFSLSQVFHIAGLAPSSQSGVRADGTFGNATYLAVYMLFNIFITLYLASEVFKEKNALRSQRVILAFYGCAIVLQFFTLFFTETRGAILGLVGGLIISALYILWRAREPQYTLLRRASVGLLLLMVVLGGVFFAAKDTAFVRSVPGLSRLASISLEDSTTKSRLFYIWPIAIKGGLEKPVFGWGQENFSYIFNQNYNPAMYGQEQWFDRAHNEFLDWLVAGGIPAFLLYISLFVLAAWAIVRAHELTAPQQAMLLGLLAGYAFNNMFVFDNLTSLIYFMLILGLAHGLSRKALPGSLFFAKPVDDKGIAIAAPIVGVLVVASLWVLNVPGITRAQTLITALQPNNPKTGTPISPEEHLASFERALNIDSNLGMQETIEQLFQFSSNSIAPSQSVSLDLKQKAFDTTLQAIGLLTQQRKDDARLELFTGVFYSQFGKLDEAIAELNRALEDSPNKQQILFQLGVVYLQKNDITRALEIFKKAYELEPSYEDARILYATAYVYANQLAQSDALLIEGFGTTLVDDNRLLQVYSNTKHFDRVIAIWKKRVEQNPKDTNTRLGLASAYFGAGDKTSTIATLREIIAIDPSAKAQMESIIKQIEDGTLKP